MKTTLIIEDGLMAKLKAEATRRGTTMSDVVDTALRNHFQTRKEQESGLPPLPTFDSGGALVDVDDRDALYRAMEGR
ncbi:MAG: CopG family transcriptional regulator [Alphaproteobacteria bacterium]